MTEASRLVLKLLVHYLLLFFMEDSEGQGSFCQVRAGSLEGASFPGVSSGTWSESPHFLFPLLPGCSTSTLLLKPVTPLGLGQCQTDFPRTTGEILRTVRVDTSHLPSSLLHFCVCLQACSFLLAPVVFRCIHNIDFFHDIWL